MGKFERKNKMKYASIFLILILTTIVGCSHAVKRTKWTDKNMRVMIDPDSISPDHYARIQDALVRSDRFVVVDRADGMNAIKKEQERLHRKEVDRFDDKEKWAHWGKLYGVGAVIIAHAQCYRDDGFWTNRLHLECYQRLAIVNANTGEVLVTAENKNDGPSSADRTYLVPDWDDVVAKLIDAYPKYFKPNGYEKQIVEYQNLSKEEALRQKELAAAEQVEKEAKERADRDFELKKLELETRKAEALKPATTPATQAAAAPVQPPAPATPPSPSAERSPASQHEESQAREQRDADTLEAK